MPEIKGRRHVHVIKGRDGGPWFIQYGQTGDERGRWRLLSWDELKRLTARPKGKPVSDADNFDARR